MNELDEKIKQQKYNLYLLNEILKATKKEIVRQQRYLNQMEQEKTKIRKLERNKKK